ncbi:class E vacuolar protein-sorting machinery protein HSE1 [Cyclospora cayetanensis]|uniref:Class E vacuolar protein-sorting machinery protein HSE1 n=1 Tax=Cyclospora cayetanensis TaxID=88456 RepID=A0A6P6RV85_9EIME|nr:class E vacuolar protein-sorting machinery protein HSE1 [Cyclospora cayetanensis]
MEGRWMGGASGAPPRASPLHQKQPPFQQQKDREGEMRQTLCEWGKGGLQWGTLRGDGHAVVAGRDSKTAPASNTPTSASSGKGGPQSGSSGAPRGTHATGSKKPPAAAPAEAHAPAPRGRGTGNTGASAASGSSSSSGGSTATSSSSSRAPVQQLPLQTEEEFLRGCGFQAIWSEHFEVSGLMSAAVKLCKLAPTEGDEEWNEALLGFHQMLGLCRARLGRHLCLLQSRLQDVQDVLQMEEEIQSRIKLVSA